MDKAFEIQRQCRDNVTTLHSYLTDLQNWESEMKRKEAALNGEFEQNLPPVRSKIKKEKPIVVKKKPEKNIKATDYESWEKFDVDKACEEVEMEGIGPVSLDGKKSQQAKMEKLREEAQYEKERGNTFVKNEKWDEALKCYNRAIELVKDDAIYYANRGLCYLKKDSLHQAESDCTEAIRLDPTYVKAYQRRATAREKLGSLRSSSQDLAEVLKLEPHNTAARKQLESIKIRMGTKGAKSKSSPITTPTDNKSIVKSKLQSKITEMPDEPKVVTAKPQSPLEKWREGVDEDVTVIKLVKKPPHLRSKRPLKSIPIQEIELGKTLPEKAPTRLKIIEIENNLAHGDSNNNASNNKEKTNQIVDGKGDVVPKIGQQPSPESVKLISDEIEKEHVYNLVAPVNSVQFMAEWKYLKGKSGARSDYLNLIEPSKLPSIFENSLESDIVSDVIHVLYENPDKFKDKTIAAFLKGLSGVKRFSAIAMFLSKTDKDKLSKLLEHCKSIEKCSEVEIADLKNKYEL